MFAHEHGPAGGDEINRIVRGGNDGRPVATHARDYSGAALKGRGLRRVGLDGEGGVIGETTLLSGHGRLRDVRIAPTAASGS